MRAFSTVCLAVVLATPALADPFNDLVKTGACFHRDYDAAHLAKNPRQRTTSMTVWIKGEADDTRSGNGTVGIGVTRRGDAVALYLSGGCDWQPFKGTPEWMPSFRKKAGAGCVTSAVPDVFHEASSAEEGGAIILDPAPGGRTMMVHMDDSQSMVRRANRARKISVRFGPDDRVFLLHRADPKVCAAVKDAVTTLEPRRESPR